MGHYLQFNLIYWNLINLELDLFIILWNFPCRVSYPTRLPNQATVALLRTGQELRLIDVTPLSLGIQTAGGFMTTVRNRCKALGGFCLLPETGKDPEIRHLLSSYIWLIMS